MKRPDIKKEVTRAVASFAIRNQFVLQNLLLQQALLEACKQFIGPHEKG